MSTHALPNMPDPQRGVVWRSKEDEEGDYAYLERSRGGRFCAFLAIAEGGSLYATYLDKSDAIDLANHLVTLAAKHGTEDDAEEPSERKRIPLAQILRDGLRHQLSCSNIKKAKGIVEIAAALGMTGEVVS